MMKKRKLRKPSKKKKEILTVTVVVIWDYLKMMAANFPLMIVPRQLSYLKILKDKEKTIRGKTLFMWNIIQNQSKKTHKEK